MAIETEVKFRMDRETWLAARAALVEEYGTFVVERQTNQYYTTADGQLEAQRIGLRLRVLDDASILCVKRDTKDAHKRQEVEERYEEILETLPRNSPVLQDLLNELGSTYDDLVPLVMLRTERTLLHITEPGVSYEVCCDDVAIVDRCREVKLYEVEFEHVDGSEELMWKRVDAFKNQHGDKVEVRTDSKLAYALQQVSCDRG